ncbi:MAG: hypothetical protein MUC54_08780 [Chloroflexi bacterium]|jgi:hypothetical protein|nr:hypothetical protein [Chloroflexota bacterium]
MIHTSHLAQAGLRGRARPPSIQPTHQRREVSAMIAIDVLQAARHERQARFRAEADARRLARRAPGRPLRRVVGQAIVRVGERLADEPAPEGLTLARTR